MARYKETEKGQGLFLTVNLNEQLVAGTFEYTLNHLIDKKLDLNISSGIHLRKSIPFVFGACLSATSAILSLVFIIYVRRDIN